MYKHKIQYSTKVDWSKEYFLCHVFLKLKIFSKEKGTQFKITENTTFIIRLLILGVQVVEVHEEVMRMQKTLRKICSQMA